MSEQKINDGGPVFPAPVYEIEVDRNESGRITGEKRYVPRGKGGVTLRDWYAANAPVEVPSWFKADTPSVHEQTKHLRHAIIDRHIQNARIRKGITDWRRDPCFDLDSIGEDDDERAFLRAYEEAFLEYQDACAEARRQKAERRFFEWRWYYADAMLAARENTDTTT